jgi:hypothetical protein
MKALANIWKTKIAKVKISNNLSNFLKSIIITGLNRKAFITNNSRTRKTS